MSRRAALRFEHPQVGELRLNREKLLVGGTDNIMLVMHHPDTGTDPNVLRSQRCAERERGASEPTGAASGSASTASP